MDLLSWCDGRLLPFASVFAGGIIGLTRAAATEPFRVAVLKFTHNASCLEPLLIPLIYWEQRINSSVLLTPMVKIAHTEVTIYGVL